MASIGQTSLEPLLEATQAHAESAQHARYVPVGPLSRGGMAELVLAQQCGVRGFSRVVALKRVLPSHANDAAFLDMFLDEARLAARLDHPHIVRIYDLGEDAGAYFLAMEYLPGEDLRQLHDVVTTTEIKVAPELAAHLVERAADALHFAHELCDEHGSPLHLVHRDVSPSNVIVTYDGQVKVVDFGIAKARTNGYETGEGVMKGKLGYLAPEQLSGGPIDRRTDVFGLGILLWELLTNVHLFARDSAVATMAAATLGEVPAIATIREDVSPTLNAIVTRALAREPDERFQTAGEMRDALEEYLRTEALPPTARDVAEWVLSLGGRRRARLKTAIARGINVRASYDALMRLSWSDRASQATPSSGSRVRQRPAWQLLVFALTAAAAFGLVAWATRTVEPQAVVEPLTATVTLESEPQGAFIFLRGEPSGRLTPATLSGLDPATPLKYRLEKPGHLSVSGELGVKAGEQTRRTVPLVATGGLVRFTRLPRGAAVRVDGQLVLAGEEAVFSPGRHVAELLVAGELVGSYPINVALGPQDITLATGRQQ